MSASGSAPLRLVLVGASGRMGREILRHLPESPALRLVGAVVSPASRVLGQDAGHIAGTSPLNVPLCASLPKLLEAADVVVDFSTGGAVSATLAACVNARVPLLIGTTGTPATLTAELERAAGQIAVLAAPNTSLGVTVLLELVRRCAHLLDERYDVEILELHHRGKRDAPSGTALALGQAAAEGRSSTLEALGRFDRHGGAAREAGQIGFASLRGGEVAGEHRVLFLGPGETLELAHHALDRGVFARGALRAAAWLAAQHPGRYAMRDVLSG